jgi:uncharacterized membrane protein (UPF0127 family)
MRRVALALLVAGAIGIVVAVVWFARDDSDGASAPVASSNMPFLLGTTPASAPFEGLTEAQLGVGGRCLHVVVADDETERVQGLRQRRDIGPYDGMLFVFDEPTNTAFTMSTVPVSLEIGFYAADGSPVSRRHMKPCPHAEANCPNYHSSGSFSYALETLGGKLPSGALSGCN